MSTDHDFGRLPMVQKCERFMRKYPVTTEIYKVTQVRKYAVLSSASSAFGVLSYLGGAVSGNCGMSMVAVMALLFFTISALSAVLSFICNEMTLHRFNDPDENAAISIYTLICLDYCALNVSVALILLGMLLGFVHLFAISV